MFCKVWPRFKPKLCGFKADVLKTALSKQLFVVKVTTFYEVIYFVKLADRALFDVDVRVP